MSNIGTTSGVGISAWRQVGANSSDRIVLDQGRPSVSNPIASFFSGWVGWDDNRDAGAALRAVVIPDLDAHSVQIVDDLLKKTITRGETLTARDVALAVQVRVRSFGAIVAQYDSPTEVFSPRTQFGHDFNIAVINTLQSTLANPSLDGLSTAEKIGVVIDTVRTKYIAHDNTKDKIISLLRGVQECCKFGEACASSANDHLRQMKSPVKNACAFVIDYRFKDGGRFFFENERGFLSGAVSALTEMVNTLGMPLTARSYERLHDLAVDQVHERDKIGADEVFEKGYRTGGVRFGFNPATNFTVQGLTEFNGSAKASAGWIEVRGSGSDRDYPHGYLLAKSATPKRCEAKVTEIIDQYHHAMARLPLDATDDAKLENIARLCQDLDQHHVFSDGNIRTVYIVLNKCLLENDMSPTLLDNPNCIDMHSIAEIVDKIKAGQVLFETNLAQPPSIIV